MDSVYHDTDFASYYSQPVWGLTTWESNHLINENKEINIFFHGWIDNSLGAAASLGGPIASSPVDQSFGYPLFVWTKHYYRHYSYKLSVDSLSKLIKLIGDNLAHELGHNLGLRHTYNTELSNHLGVNFLADVFGDEPAGSGTECENDAYHVYQGCTFPLGTNNALHSCTNNLMGKAYADTPYISPLQLGRIDRNLRLNAIREYVADCPYTSTKPWVVFANETWDFDIRMYENIVVKKGATLTIRCVVRMPEQGRIIVERGGKLVVNGGRITNACDGKKWSGIEVWGNPAVHTKRL